MIGYASRTGTRRNLDALRSAGWRLIVSARGALRTEGFRYALDNGAWTAHQRGETFDEAAFLKALDALGYDADFVVLPDIVAGGLASLEMSLSWLGRLRPFPSPLLLPVQNGMALSDVQGVGLGQDVGLFLGGDDTFKEGTAVSWGKLAAEVGCWYHIGRVNSMRRIRIAGMAGAHSFDGSGVSRFQVELSRLDRERRRMAYLFPNTKEKT